MAVVRETRRFVSLANLAAMCGGLSGVGGFVHGVGEVQQGTGATGGVVFDSWAEGRIAENLGGEPAMSLVPNVLITGVSTIVVSLAVLTWAVGFVDHRYAGGRVLVLLSVLMLLVGGGFGPPVVGILAGAVAGGAHARRQRWAGVLGGRLGRLLASSWPGLFWLSALDVTFLVLGSLVLGVALDVAAPDLFVYALFVAVVAMPLATLAGIARDLRAEPDAARTGPEARP